MSQKLRAFGLVALHCGCLSFFASPVSAQLFSSPEMTKQASALPLEFNNDNAPSGFDGQGRPRSRTSGGSRGGCGDLLVALLPGSDVVQTTDATTACNLASASDLAATLESNPTLWFHVPAQVQSDVVAELVLLDNNEQVLSSDMVALPIAGGVIGLQLSHDLETNQVYHWIFSILNQPNSPSQNPTVEGSLQRTIAVPSLLAALNTAQGAPSRIQALAQYGIWHDALHGLALLYQAEPNNIAIQDDWASLLSSVGLEEIAEEKPVDCCLN
ncbi:DUF928 domain-containing protein [Leptothoe spongobia]|uniref:DUF928 domain-containing protein n=1 Tax=Leptothoe spongobia TAU-MAC 1115 TaxID=1967444 RepID=A0A947GKK9_9CYAN|nr:DUF928 domain-containing protein [Leptothoe spongobia]MBT9316903.1 DUF928 domain-containing protein [Leptothoe spongobia TAU-MAC 1115]